MAEYIKREAAKDAVSEVYYDTPDVNLSAEKFEAAINAIPTADVAPVVRTLWAHLGGDEWCCPVCGFVITTEGSWDKPTKKYCEDCGAKMDGGDDDG
jgi:hypothetical protein